MVEKAHDSKRDNLAKFIPTCHFCQTKGHIKPNCFKLYGYPQGFRHYKKDSIRNGIFSFTKLRKIESMKSKHVSENRKNIEKIQTRQIWIRKRDLCCMFVHTAFKACNSHIWYLDSGCSRHVW